MVQVFPHVFHYEDLNFELKCLSTHEELISCVAMVRRKKDLSLTKFVLLSNLCSSMHSCSCFLEKGFPFLFFPFCLFYQIGETKCVFCTDGKMKIKNGLGDLLALQRCRLGQPSIYWPIFYIFNL